MVRPLFLGLSPCAGNSAALKNCCLVVNLLPSDVVSGRQTNNKYLKLLLCKIDAAAISAILHQPFSQVFGWLWSVDVDGSIKDCAVELFSGVQWSFLVGCSGAF